jgi:NodT family efflux transporter outer membrane factor (OMF) lipoprotein
MKRVTLSACLLVTGCQVGRDYFPPKVETPAQWSESTPNGVPVPAAWWSAFGDPILTDLVQRSANANSDVRIAVARLRTARAERGFAEAQLWPRVDVNGSYSYSRFSENGFIKGFGSGDELPGAVGPGQEINLWQGGLDASWELDLFGGKQKSVEAARADVDASAFDVADVLVSVTAEVASTYVELRALQGQLATTQQEIGQYDESLSIVREQATAGLASDLDVARAETLLSSASARAPALDAGVRVAIRRLETLVGVQPGMLDETLTPVQPIPSVPDAFAADIPAEILRRRPDVRAAERRLAAATARIGVAEADLYPRVSLTGSFGFQAQDAGDLPEWDSRFFSIGPAVRWPLFDMGRVRSRIAAQDARAQIAEEQFGKAVLTALGDTETALVRLARAGKTKSERDKARDAARRAVEIARSMNTNGVLEFLDLLDTQRTLEVAEAQSVRAEADVAGDTIALFRALGGGWESASAEMAKQ